MLAFLRHKRDKRLRRRAGLLAFLVVNVSIMPCAMAFDVDADCPHCPPVETHEMAGHHGHEKVTDCATLKADCADADEYSVDSRSGKLDDSASADPILAPAPETRAPAISRAYLRPPALGPPAPGVGPHRLHLLNCVFID